MDRRGFIRGALALTALSNLDISRAAANSIVTSVRSSALPTEIWNWGALDTARAILRRDVSCREVTEAALRRIEAVNHKINAVVDILPNESLAAADIADAQLREGIRPGPLFGVPITIKDNTDQKGRRTVNGLVNAPKDPAIMDSPVVQNLRTSGSIIVGRTNTPCLSSRWDTDNQVYGRTHNPYSHSRTTGGSSGGAAAGLAVGIGALAHGNDIGGSIRYPAFCCGVTGLRPSMGRTPMFNATAANRSFCNQMFNVEGVLSRDVRDLAHSLSSLSVGSVQDPLWCGTPIGGADMSPRRKIGLVTGASGLSVAREISNTITQAGQRLSERGYVVEVVNPPSIEETVDLWAKLVFSELRLSWKWFEGVADQDAVKANQYFLEAAPQLDFEGYMTGISEVLAVRRKWAAFMEEYPILIAPNSGALPFSIGFDTSSLDATRHQIAAQALMVTVNLLGLPSVAVPTNLVEAPDAPRGLPIGVQVIGPRYLDELALMIAAQVQDDAGAVTIIDPG